VIRHALATTLLALAVAGCSGSDVTPTGPSGTVDPAAARAFVEEVLGLMQANSLHRLRVNWDDLRARVLAAAATARTVEDTKSALGIALQALGDRHSSIRDAEGGLWLFAGGQTCGSSTRTQPAVPADVGYVWVRSFAGSSDSAPATTYAEGMQAEIARQDREDLAGWVVDIRANGGGNMWPMIAGAGPLLGDGVAGHFIGPVAGQTIAWGYRAGASFLGTNALTRVSAPHTRRSRSARVAVLTDAASASSGEAAFIAFIGRPETRTFGQPTCGLSTANSGYPLSNGMLLNLTVSVMADRTERAYGGPVPPDEVLVNPAEAFDRAVSWVRDGR
jgi:carboxyl-terminal processing protease